MSRHPGLIEFGRQFRDYRKPGYAVAGLNYRMSEFTAALGVVQVDRLPAIVEWKNEVAARDLDARFPSRLRFPDGMVSGLYKYIVFDLIEKSTGKVYDQPCHLTVNHGPARHVPGRRAAHAERRRSYRACPPLIVSMPSIFPITGCAIWRRRFASTWAPSRPRCFEAVTDERGDYRIPARVGAYRLTAELAGFAPVTRTVTLLVGQQAVVNLQIAVSGVQESVTVTGEAPLLDVTQSSMGGNVDPRSKGST